MNGVNNVRSDVNRAIWRLFKKRGITIPVAQRELRMLEPVERTRRAARATDDGGFAASRPRRHARRSRLSGGR